MSAPTRKLELPMLIALYLVGVVNGFIVALQVMT